MTDADLDADYADLVADYARVTSYVSLTLCGVGVCSNMLAMRVLLKGAWRAVSSSIFLFWLTIADTIVLVCESLDDLAEQLPDYKVADLEHGSNQWRCRIGTFVRRTGRLVSSWLVVALAAELALTYDRPERARAVCTRGRAFYVTMAVTLVGVAAAFPLVVITTAADSACSSSYEVFYDLYRRLVLGVATDVAAPLLVIAICLGKCIVVFIRKDSLAAPPDVIDVNDNQTLAAKTSMPFKCVVVLAAIFAVSTTPAAIIEAVDSAVTFDVNLTPSSHYWKIARLLARCLLLVNYSLKLFVFLLLYKQFRAAFGSISTCGLIRQKKRFSDLTYKPSNVFEMRDRRSTVRY